MGNPAFELADAMDSWKGDSKTPVEVRGGQHPGSASFWREQARFADTVRSLELLIDASDGALEFYRPYVTMWYQAVFSFSTAWNSRGTVASVDVNASAMLRALGALWDAQGRPGVLAQKQRQGLRACVDDAVTLLAELDDVLLPAERAYVLRLLDSIRVLLDEKSIGLAVDLQALIDQLTGSLMGIAVQIADVTGDDARAGRLRSIVGRLIQRSRIFLHDSAAVSEVTSGVAEAVKAIASGG